MTNQSLRYKINSAALILTHSDSPTVAGKRYELSVRDLPAEEKPREKMLSSGPGALSTQDLLAVILNTGTRKEGLLAMISRILREYGEKSIFAETNAQKMASELNIPISKALQIIAVGELGRRFFRSERNGATVLRTTAEVAKYASDMRGLSKEHLRGIYLNAHYQVIHDEVISIGTVDANIVHPREVFRPAIAYGAVAIILVHNHPSGISKPSQEDIHMTRQIMKAGNLMGIELIDHVIVTSDSFVSIPLE